MSRATRNARRAASVVLAAGALLFVASPAFAGDEYGDCSASTGEHFVNVQVTREYRLRWEDIVENPKSTWAEYERALGEETRVEARVVGSYHVDTEAKFKVLKVGIEARAGGGIVVEFNYNWTGTSYAKYKTDIAPKTTLHVIYRQGWAYAKGDVVYRYANCVEKPVAEDVVVHAPYNSTKWTGTDAPSGEAPETGLLSGEDGSAGSAGSTALQVANPVRETTDVTGVSPSTTVDMVADTPQTACEDVQGDARYADATADETTGGVDVHVSPPDIGGVSGTTQPATSASTAADPCDAAGLGVSADGVIPGVVTP